MKQIFQLFNFLFAFIFLYLFVIFNNWFNLGNLIGAYWIFYKLFCFLILTIFLFILNIKVVSLLIVINGMTELSSARIQFSPFDISFAWIFEIKWFRKVIYGWLIVPFWRVYSTSINIIFFIGRLKFYLEGKFLNCCLFHGDYFYNI